MHGEPIELAECWWDLPDGGAVSRIGQAGVTRIYMLADGNGPLGYYDRIHVEREDGKHTIYPAHHASGWNLAVRGPQKEDEGHD